MKLLRKIKKLKKINKNYINRLHYLEYMETLPLNEKAIVLEAQHGTDISGNIFYLLSELCTNQKYSDFEKYIVYAKKDKEKIAKILNSYEFNGYTMLERYTADYYKLMASAKYLMNDNTILPFFIKREGQVYLNTWHGTPLKTLGKKINNDFHNIGNTQKNFIIADYLLYPNKYTMNHMVEDYMLEGISESKIVLSGYPRNSIFLNEVRSNEVKSLLGLDGKEIFIYMPTWRGTIRNKENDEQIEQLKEYLRALDEGLTDDQVLYVKLHPIVNDMIELDGFKHIKNSPKNLETYDFLNIADCLITDYSSVMYDFAIKNKKIILFTYDKNEYFEDRGVYMPLEDLPFAQVETVEGLLEEMNCIKEVKYDEFQQEFCKYDHINVSEYLLDCVLFNQKENVELRPMPKNGKENVLIFVGNLAKNGITSSVMSLLSNIDTSKRNYYLTFTSRKVAPYRQTLLALPENVKYIAMTGNMNANLKEKNMLKKYRKDKVSMDSAEAMFKRLYSYEKRRCFGNISFDHVIHFTGYEFKRQIFFSNFGCDSIIYVHSNMVEEIKTRNNQHPASLMYAYEHFDKIALITEDMRESTMEFCNNASKIRIASNCIDYKRILEKAEDEIEFEENTVCNKELEDLKMILDDKTCKKFITIGRYSPEKGHKRLLESFNKIWENQNNVYMVIIGGHGVDYNETVEFVETLPSKDHIILIKSMTNPYTVLKKCDYFVLSSFYEGLGLVILEADILGVPAFSTNILGPRGFMQKYHGELVENTDDGLYNGMRDCLEGKIKCMNIDYAQYNAEAVQEFENLLLS